MFKGLGGMGDIGKMMSAAKEMQAKMEALQEEAASAEVTGEAGGGLVRATVTGKGDLKALDIDPSIFVASEKEVVEGLIVAAVADAQAKGRDEHQRQMAKMAEGLGLPPGMKLPF
ncbi:MAG: YbaB/EbfC family nucleoid-associated protein [Hasllibacter sp.]